MRYSTFPIKKIISTVYERADRALRPTLYLDISLQPPPLPEMELTHLSCSQEEKEKKTVFTHTLSSNFQSVGHYMLTAAAGRYTAGNINLYGSNICTGIYILVPSSRSETA